MISSIVKKRGQKDKKTAAQMNTVKSLASSIFNYIMYFIIVTVTLSIFGVNVSSILAVAGVGGIAISFGAQTLVKDIISGMFIWTGTDYLGESNAWPSRGFYSGLLDFGSFPKPRGRFFASLWSESPVCYLGTSLPRPGGRSRGDTTDAWDSWNYEPGQTVRVVCYTNAASAALFLNGKQVGARQDYNRQTGIIGWDVPYAPGTLRAVGYDASGKEESSYEITTSLRPKSLRVSADRTALREGGVAHLTVEVLDDNGNFVPLADNEITCTVEGPAVLLGLEGSDNRDMGSYTDNVQRAYRGRLLAYLRATGSGPVTVRFSAPLLQGASVTLSAAE
jgi:hypothetical protein